MIPATDGWLVFGDVATAVAALAALATVIVTVVLGLRTARALRDVGTAASATARELRDVGTAVRETATLTVDVVGGLRESAEWARETAELVRTTGQEAIRAQRDAERARIRSQYEAIGRLVEEIFFAAYSEMPGHANDWMSLRNQLAVAIVGHKDELPLCADVVLSNSKMDAQGKAGRARLEAPTAIERLLRSD